MEKLAWVYLIHFERPLRTGKRSCQHYLGSSVNVEQRVRQHKQGNGALLLRLVNEVRIPWAVVKTWKTTVAERYKLERRLKRSRNYKRFCFRCSR